MDMYRTKSITVLMLTAAVGIFIPGCSSPDSTGSTPGSKAPKEKLRVSCTTDIVKDLVQQIGGQHLVVSAIMDGPAIDPHLYTPSPQDINILTDSDVVIYSGLHLEAQFEGALESLRHRGIPTIKVTDVLEKEFSNQLLHADGAIDPHVWFDLELWGKCGTWLAEQLAEVDSVHATDYHAAAVEFQQLMKTTRETGEKTLSSIPADRRILVTAHDAFQYFARMFDFRVEAVQGLSTESEPGLKRINELSDLLVEMKISAIFTEQSVSDRNILALISECESHGHQLAVGGTLYSDTAGPAGTPEATLAGAVMHNIREIARGLGAEPSGQEIP